MKNLFIPYELAIIAKEKGFNEPCLAVYVNAQLDIYVHKDDFGQLRVISNAKSDHKNLIAAPLYSQIVDWFREKQKIHIQVTLKESLKRIEYEPIFYKDKYIHFASQDYKGGELMYVTYINYYEALNKAIEEAFNLI